jgi:hypothetical protein
MEKNTKKGQESQAVRWPRITGEGIEYCNPFRVHVQNKPIFNNLKHENLWNDEAGYFSDGCYLIKLNNPPKTNKQINPIPTESIKSQFPKNFGNGTRFRAEVKPENKDKPLIFVYGNDFSGWFDPKYIDHILTIYPDAVPYLESNIKLCFHNEREVLGIVMGIKSDISYDELLNLEQMD